MTNLDKFNIPSSIKNIINNLPYEINNDGFSGSTVIIFDDYTLKISSLPFDIKNEERVYNALKGKLPIPDIIECVYFDNKIYLLKTKLKGKMLSDSYYMNNPKLLYKLASEAIKLLWQVDINNLDIQDTYKTIIEAGTYFYQNNLIKFEDTDRNITKDFNSYDEVFKYLKDNKPTGDKVLAHADLCLTNIICDNDKIVGFIDLGLTGISNRYHDLAILYRSIKYNFSGIYGKSYDGYDDNLLFDLLGIKKDEEKIKYYLILDEVLG